MYTCTLTLFIILGINKSLQCCNYKGTKSTATFINIFPVGSGVMEQKQRPKTFMYKYICDYCARLDVCTI